MISRGDNHLLGLLIVEELWRLGVRTFVLSPGSRSTPLAVALAERRDSTVVHIDERGAGYFGFGAALGGGAPVALVCTSGTAVANYLPAVVEASESGIPLFVISADRPLDLLDTGANQTIRHRGIFSSYVRAAAEVVAPRSGEDARKVLRLVDDLFSRAIGSQPGPVHLNVAFRKPLLERSESRELPPLLDEWDRSGEPLCVVSQRRGCSSAEDRICGAGNPFSGFIEGSTAGLILVSGIDGARGIPRACLEIAEMLRWPIIADITSQLRVGVESPLLFAEASAVYEIAEARSIFAPDKILHIGTQPVSNGLLELLAQCPAVAHCSITGMRSDVVGNNRVAMVATPEELFEILKRCDALTTPSRLIEAFNRLRAEFSAISGAVSIVNASSELAAVDAIVSELPKGWQLYLANSLPIRLVDSSIQRILHPVRVGYHRGASGIDGTIAAACGFAHGSWTPTVAIVGDLAAIHDVNSLLFAARSKLPVVIVIINNSGGGIFSTLPDINDLDCFEDFFITPQRVDFEGAAHFSGLPFERVHDEKAVAVAVQRAIQRGCSSIIEVVTDWRRTAPAIAARREIIKGIIGGVSRDSSNSER